MNVYQACFDTSDAIELFLPQNLYLKPIARLNISVQLPQLKVPGKSISNWEVMEKVRNIIKPEQFSSLKVSKSTLEFVRLEGEIENKSKVPLMMAKLDSRTIKLSGFTDVLKVRAAEAKIPYPTRHMWDSYFRDSKHMNDIKPGERPDTIHICNLPCKWFTEKLSKSDGRDLPSEYIFKKVFEAFGEVRCFDIPMLDPLRNIMKNSSGIQTFYFGQDHSFEGYIQFKEYVCFVKAMTALKGMKLLYKDGDKAWTANIKVDFDKTKHLSDESINKRVLEREKILLERKLEKEEEERRLREIEEKKKEEQRQKKMEEEAKIAREKQLIDEKEKRKENKRKEKEIQKQKQVELEERNFKIAEENAILVQECSRIKSMRLLEYLLEKAKVRMEREIILKKKEELLEKIKNEKEKKKEMETKEKDKLALINKEKELRRKLLIKYKSLIQKKLENEERKINKLIGIKKRMLVANFSSDAKNHCIADQNSKTYEQHDTSAEDYPMPEKSGIGADELSELSSVELKKSPKWEQFLSKIPPLSLDITTDGSCQNEPALKTSIFYPSQQEEIFQAVSSSDSNQEILTEKYISSLEDFCQRHLRKMTPKSNGNSPEQHRGSGKERESLRQNGSVRSKRKSCDRESSTSKELNAKKHKRLSRAKSYE